MRPPLSGVLPLRAPPGSPCCGHGDTERLQPVVYSLCFKLLNTFVTLLAASYSLCVQYFPPLPPGVEILCAKDSLNQRCDQTALGKVRCRSEHAQRERERCGGRVGTFCSWPRDSVGKVLWDFNSSCLMSWVNIVFCSCLLGANLSVKVAEVSKAGTENYLVTWHVV